MKALVQDRYGPPAEVLSLREIETPTPEPGRVLIRVVAASVNALDWHMVEARPALVRLDAGFRRPKAPTPGVDVAGVVEAVGSDVTRFKPGDEVFGFARGAFAEFAVAREDRIVAKPAAITFEQAASVPIAAVTALQGLRDQGRLEAGQRVMVIGASGGVGSFAVQIAKAMGAEVTAVCSTRNVELVRSMGADHVLDYTRDDVAPAGARFDVILQLAGTQSPLALRRSLTPTGRLVLSSGMGSFAGMDRVVVGLVASPFVSQTLKWFLASSDGKDLATVARWLEDGSVVPVIDRRGVDRSFGLPDVPDAIRYLEQGHTQGKVVITV